MQRAGRVGRDKFHHHRLSLTAVGAAVVFALAQNGGYHVLPGGAVNAQVDETGACDFCAGQPIGGRQGLDQLARQLARIAPQRLGELHCRRAGIIAMLRLLGPLERNHGCGLLRRYFGEGVRQQFGQMRPDLGGHAFRWGAARKWKRPRIIPSRGCCAEPLMPR